VSRLLADELAKQWKQTVIVENRAGADHMLAAQTFLGARDGHTLLFTTHSTLTVNPLLHDKLPYDPVQDFAPISLVVEDFLCVVAAPSLAINSLGEAVNLARSKPRELNSYAVPGSPHLSLLAFQKRHGIATTFISYRNPISALADLSEGRIHLAVVPFALVRGLEGGKVKLLVVTNATRSPAAPATPTAAEAGYSDLTFGGLLGLFGPRDMPSKTIEFISAYVRKALAKPEATQRLTNLGLMPRGTTPVEFASILDEQRAKWAAIAREHKIQPQAAP
jgi:tripartite-type tricarboxylate transporter receptor subunit TctC